MIRLCLLLVFSASALVHARPIENDSLIAVLRREIDQRHLYVTAKEERIERLKKNMLTIRGNDIRSRFLIYNALYHEYKTFNYDSGFNYANKLIQTAKIIGDRSLIGYARVKLGFILISSGMFKETFDSLKAVETSYLADSTKADYYRLLSRAYSDLNIYNKDNHYYQTYDQLDLAFLDSALMFSGLRSYGFYYLNAVRSLHLKKYPEVIQFVDTLVRTKQLSDPQRAMNFFDVANAYRAMGDTQEAIRYLVMSSLSDIRAATKETAAMHNLAKVLYEEGDVENAYVFIQQALEDAEFYGARQRKVEIGSILPVIAAARLHSIDAQRRAWLLYSTAASLLSITVIAFAYIIFKQVKRLKAAEATILQTNRNLQAINQKLLEADRIKEEYIGYYFSNHSTYLEKMETFKRSINLKIQHRKVDDIKYLVSTIDPSHDREELYANFDKIFLKLFPDFITIFNSYFHPHDRVTLKDGQLLNTELRIFALIRLGISDAEKIARILGYSVNTIYAYKNRVKSKSMLPNDVFEQKVMEINSVSFLQP